MAKGKASPFKKAWKYLMALFGHKLEEAMDPRIQIEQAREAEIERHRTLTAQAASVVGNARQIEVKLARKREDVSKLESNTRQAVNLAEQAAKSGDTAKANEYTQAAETFANQLVSAENEVAGMEELYAQTEQAAENAKQAARQSEARLSKFDVDRSRVLAQLDAAKMQETVSASLSGMTALNDSDVPSLEGVREKIEARYANALGTAELAAGSVQGRMREIEQASLDAAGSERLRQIRASLRGEPLAPQPSVVTEASTVNVKAATAGEEEKVVSENA